MRWRASDSPEDIGKEDRTDPRNGATFCGSASFEEEWQSRATDTQKQGGRDG